MALFARNRIVLILLCGCLAFYALLGFVIAPYVVQTYVIPALSERLRHPVLLGDVRINPFTFSVTLKGFEIQEPDRTPMVGFQELFVDFEGTSLVSSAYTFDEIRLTLPFGLMHLRTDGTLNLLGLAPPASEQPPQPVAPEAKTQKTPLPPVEIRLLSIQRGVIEYRDDTKQQPITIDVVPIEITLRNFGTRRGGENAYAFSAEFGEGEVLAWEGTLHLDPLESDGHVSLSHVDLTTFWPSLRDRFRFDILSGTFLVDGRYHFDTHQAPVNLQINDAKIELADFRLAAAGSRDPVITLPSVGVHGIRLDLPQRVLGIGGVVLSGADVRAWLAEDGVVNFKPLFAPVPAPEKASGPTEPPAPAAAGPPWTVDVQAVEVDKSQVEFEDRTLATPAQVTIENLQVTAKDLHVPFRGSIPVTAGFTLNQQGTFDSRGTLQLDPLQASLSLKLAHIGLRPFQPYLDRTMQVDITDGEVELDGEVTYRSRPESEPMLRYVGQVGVNKLHVAERVSGKEFLGWTAFGLQKVELDLSPTKVKIGEIALRDPAVRLVTGKDGSLNLSKLMRKTEPQAAESTPPPAARESPGKKTAPTPVDIDVVRLSKLSATFIDESIDPVVATGITDLSGTIKGLSSKQVAKAQVVLAGEVDEVAPIKIQGQINPLSEDAYTHLTFLFQGVDLTAVSPYAGKYVGYPITKGKLSLDLMYQVSKKQLVGENKVLVDQLTFGEKTDSPDATSLPVRLAVGLLKDRRGLIDIDLPVRGDLNEPDFRYGRVVLNALVNLITKVATSPFSALGGLVGGGGEDLQFIEFAAGIEEVGEAEQRKIDSIANALQERPALRVDVIGTADPARDRDALAMQKISADVQRRFTQGGTKNLQAVLSPSREFELLSDLYAEKLGKQPMKKEELPGGKSVERVLTADELRQQLVPAMGVEESELRLLAQGRAKAIRERLIEQGGLPEDRVFLVEVELAQSEGKPIRAHLNLTGN
ncbi:DUF748 domain-containing protein [Nitrospira defluvii]|uniref:DUF748 domain-containing protein n=1 Tax=Nitrospira defluvii TaxID=330214 RepID=A0ABN7L147_9BACT|nr:DUF748 domain-containing protein [Nitrospira defluvii]CAE6725329.1 conserved hypothetical protein [Nitrospira defluvii]